MATPAFRDMPCTEVDPGDPNWIWTEPSPQSQREQRDRCPRPLPVRLSLVALFRMRKAQCPSEMGLTRHWPRLEQQSPSPRLPGNSVSMHPKSITVRSEADLQEATTPP